MPYCFKCGRALKRQPWANLGIGPICQKKVDAERDSHFAQTEDIVETYDGGAIFIERLPMIREDFAGNLHALVDTATGVRTNVQPLDMKKSPTGFNYGYGGSGPSCFALNVMLMFCKDADDAWKIYQDFKRKFVEPAPQHERLEIPRGQIENFIRARGVQLRNE